jgi:hypothetical protein
LWRASVTFNRLLFGPQKKSVAILACVNYDNPIGSVGNYGA